MAVATCIGPHGEILHIIDQPAAQLPPVTRRDLEQAWDAAQAGGAHGPSRAFRFAAASAVPGAAPGAAPGGAPGVELVLTDADATAWAGALDQVMDLSTTRGVSICLRLLALVEAMGRAEPLRRFFAPSRRSFEIHPALLQAAALAPLNETAGFDETALLTLLPPA
jgi:hypothetical protein